MAAGVAAWHGGEWAIESENGVDEKANKKKKKKKKKKKNGGVWRRRVVA
jgi:hypothetical protein